ncbi:hypothetical protein Clacol_006733 [Clathrus columnatus]|uniref:Uncharacterized protein n=1 Tax=Clathrus columnatus TaxID=1419009 RepID=A0AAV5AHQ6_9AGAM|nr:hypothetical protein Clacol_006733 [Clathrus columnatus]
MSQKPPGDISRIQIDNIEDWTKIQTNFTDAILSSLSQKLADTETQEVVKAHLLRWRENIFQLAKPNLRVNGRNLEDYAEGQEGNEMTASIPDTEPFDEILDRRIWSLNAERMVWDKELGDRRRRIPTEIEHLVESMLTGEEPSLEEAIPEIQMEEEDNLGCKPAVAELFQETFEIFQRLDQKAPQLLERTERARNIAEEIRSLST